MLQVSHLAPKIGTTERFELPSGARLVAVQAMPGSGTLTLHLGATQTTFDASEPSHPIYLGDTPAPESVRVKSTTGDGKLRIWFRCDSD